MKSPELRIFAGPNGSGKNTLMPAFGIVGSYINTGEIARVTGTSSNKASKESDHQKQGCMGVGASFTVKTVLESERTFELVESARMFGYSVTGVYMFTRNVDINIARVIARAAAGNYGVPRDEVISNYQRSLLNLPKFIEVCDNITVVDTSEKPIIVYRKTMDKAYKIVQGVWTEAVIDALTKEGVILTK